MLLDFDVNNIPESHKEVFELPLSEEVEAVIENLAKRVADIYVNFLSEPWHQEQALKIYFGSTSLGKCNYPISEEVQNFKSQLISQMVKEFNAESEYTKNKYHQITLTTHYCPEGILYEACSAANLVKKYDLCSLFPKKSELWIHFYSKERLMKIHWQCSTRNGSRPAVLKLF